MENIIDVEPPEGVFEFSSYHFYTFLLPEIQKYVENNNGNVPIISFKKLNRINPLVLPNLLAVGSYLKRLNKDKPIILLINNNPWLNCYLEYTRFFSICGDEQGGLNIFKFEKNFLGGYPPQKPKLIHRLYEYPPIDGDIQDEKFRDDLNMTLTSVDLEDQFGTILMNSVQESLLKDVYYESIAEPISNGMLHSNSYTWAIAQSFPERESKTVLSISDAGIGFEKSLQKNPNYHFYIIEKAESTKRLKEDNLRDFYFIMEALFYSLIKKRSGLIDFIIFTASKGIVRIHYNSTQILFAPRIFYKVNSLITIREKIKNEHKEHGKITENIFKKAIDEIIKLSDILLSYRSNDTRFSAVRIFDVIFEGVHIEFQLS